VKQQLASQLSISISKLDGKSCAAALQSKFWQVRSGTHSPAATVPDKKYKSDAVQTKNQQQSVIRQNV